MQSEEDREYFLMREGQERLAAEGAQGSAKAAHSELANRYEELSTPARKRKLASRS